jgi:hypothetical protein
MSAHGTLRAFSIAQKSLPLPWTWRGGDNALTGSMFLTLAVQLLCFGLMLVLVTPQLFQMISRDVSDRFDKRMRSLWIALPALTTRGSTVQQLWLKLTS